MAAVLGVVVLAGFRCRPLLQRVPSATTPVRARIFREVGVIVADCLWLFSLLGRAPSCSCRIHARPMEFVGQRLKTDDLRGTPRLNTWPLGLSGSWAAAKLAAHPPRSVHVVEIPDLRSIAVISGSVGPELHCGSRRPGKVWRAFFHPASPVRRYW